MIPRKQSASWHCVLELFWKPFIKEGRTLSGPVRKYRFGLEAKKTILKKTSDYAGCQWAKALRKGTYPLSS